MVIAGQRLGRVAGQFSLGRMLHIKSAPYSQLYPKQGVEEKSQVVHETVSYWAIPAAYKKESH